MSARAGARGRVVARRRTAVTAVLAASAVSVVGVSGTSQADTLPPSVAALGAPIAAVTAPLAPVTAPVAQAVQPVAQAAQPVAQAAKPVAQAAKPVTQVAKPVTQAVAAASKPVRQAVATATKPVTQAVAAAKPVVRAVAATTKPAVQVAARAATPVTQSAARAATPVAKPVTKAVAVTGAPVQSIVRSARKAVAKPVAVPVEVRKATSAVTAVAARSQAKVVRATRSNATGNSAPTRRAVAAARPHRHLHVVQASGATRSRAIGGGRVVLPVAPPQPVAASLRPATARGPVTFAGVLVAAPSAPAPVSVVPAPSGGGGSSDTALGLAALLGAGGAGLLRLRQSAAATGLGDAGTLTALGHSASVFWAGSCYPLGGTSSSASLTSSLAAGVRPAVEIIPRSRGFGAAGVVPGASEAVGGRVSPAATAFVRAPGDDRTGLVVTLFAASAAIGAVLGAIVPGRRVIRS